MNSIMPSFGARKNIRIGDTVELLRSTKQYPNFKSQRGVHGVAEMNFDSVRAQPHHGVDQSAVRLGFLAVCELALRHVSPNDRRRSAAK
jgi:hypothetical protein